MRVAIVLALIALAALAALRALRALERAAIYPRPAAGQEPDLPPDVVGAWLGPAADLEAWFLPPLGNGIFPVLIFTHGNGELIDDWLEPFASLRDSGVGVLLVEYPGYGRSGGSPSEATISEAMVTAYDWLLDQPRVDASRIVAYGRSLGGGAACVLAGRRALAGLILESTFTSVGDLAPWFIPEWLLANRFDNLAAVRAFDGPVLVVHGVEDRVIPFSHAEALAAAAGITPVAQRCGHNDCPRPWESVLEFLGSGLR